ncbi:hypothetical protein H8E88_34070 [candidate division KSB1 bacterium]|nr:hypothetical protein [candidate division KSB1 bacterium]
MSRQEVINIVSQLSDDQLQNLVDYIKLMFSKKTNVQEKKLNQEQKELLDLLNYTIDSGREDFAEHHDRYLYGERK